MPGFGMLCPIAEACVSTIVSSGMMSFGAFMIRSTSIPIRVRRPSAAWEALSLSPLVKASWADASSIERIPRMTALAEPLVLFTRRPAAQRAADARWFRLAGLLLFLKLAVWNDDRIVSDPTHAAIMT